MEDNRSLGLKTVLIVEDENCIVELVRLALESRGHRVLSAFNGSDGMKVSSETIQPIDLLICDLVLPRSGAGEVIDAVRKTHPAVKVLVISGYALESVPGHAISGPFCFLQKPFNVQQLAECVRCTEEVRFCDEGNKSPRLGSGGADDRGTAERS